MTRLFVTKTDPGCRLESAGTPENVIRDLAHLLDAGQLASVIETLQRIHKGKAALHEAATRTRVLETERARKGLPPLRAYGVREVGQVLSDSPEAHEYVREQQNAAYDAGMLGMLLPDSDEGEDALTPADVGRMDAGHGVQGPHCTQAQGAD